MIAVGIVFLMVLAGIGLFRAFFLSPSRVDHPSTVESVEGGPVVFQSGDLPRFPPHKSGQPVSREQYLTIMMDESATELARTTFRKSANESWVNWLLKADDIAERNGKTIGKFSLPYQIQHGGGFRGSSLYVTVEFDDNDSDRLLQVRRGDWVHVEGELNFDKDSTLIKRASIKEGPEIQHAEKP